MDYIIAIDDNQVRLVVKPFVELILEISRRMFPDADFLYTPDEFMRDNPGKYELNIEWWASNEGVIIVMLKLVHPLQLDKTEVYVHRMLDTTWHPNAALVLELFNRQREVGQTAGEDGPDNLRLTW